MKNIIALSLLAAAVSATAVPLPFSTDFNSYANGNLNLNPDWFHFPSTNASRMQIQSAVSVTGKAVKYDMSTVTGTDFTWVDFGYNTLITPNKLVTTSMTIKGTEVGVTGSAWAGVDIYDSVVDRMLLVTPLFSNDVDDKGQLLITDWNGAAFDLFVFTIDPNGIGSDWNKLEIVQNFANATYYVKWNGNALPFVLRTLGTTTLGDCDLRAGSSNGNQPISVYFDDYSVTAAAPATITGTVTLEGYVGLGGVGQDGQAIIGQLYSGSTKVDSVVAISNGAGAVSFTSSAPNGVYDLYLTGANCLQKKVSCIIAGGAASIGAVQLTNGNSATADQVVDLSDYTIVATAFNGLLDTDPGTAGNQPSANWDGNADLNGDGVIDLTDYTIIATNFNALGDTTP